MNEKIYYRNFTLELDRSNPEVLTATLSSETPVRRDFGLEVLDHSPGSVDLSRAANGLPILYQHEMGEIIGRAEGLRLIDRKLKANFRRAKTARAGEIWGMVDEKILMDVSVSYELDFNQVERDGETLRFKRWTPLEVSLVSIGADPAAGIGRSKNFDEGVKKDMEAELGKERIRVAEILAIGKKAGMMDAGSEFIEQGKSIDSFREYVLTETQKKLDSRIEVNHSDNGGKKPHLVRRGPFIGKRFSEVFGYEGNLGKWRSLDEYSYHLVNRIPDPRFEKRTHSEGVGASGGFLLPSLISQMWYDNSLEESLVLARASIWPMSVDTLRVPGMKIGSHASGLYGGVYGSWSAEGQQANEQNAAIREVNFTAHKLFLYTKATNELIADSPIDMVIRTAFNNASNYFLDDSFLTGDGIAKPLGVLNSGNRALLTVTRNTASQVKYVDLTAMIAKLNPNSFRRAVWLIHPTTLDYLNRLIIYDGATAIDHYPMLGEGGAMTLLSRPVFVTEKIGSLGSEYDVALVDFSQYGIGLRADLGIQTSTDELFSRDMSSYRLIVRVDGCPLWNEALTLKDGTAQVSPYVALV